MSPATCSCVHRVWAGYWVLMLRTTKTYWTSAPSAQIQHPAPGCQPGGGIQYRWLGVQTVLLDISNMLQLSVNDDRFIDFQRRYCTFLTVFQAEYPPCRQWYKNLTGRGEEGGGEECRGVEGVGAGPCWAVEQVTCLVPAQTWPLPRYCTFHNPLLPHSI